MAAFIFIDDGDKVDEIRFWNRRKRCWQLDLTKSCIYPTMRGTMRTAQRLFNSETDHFRPGMDWLGTHCLRDFADNGYRKIRIRIC